MIVASQERAQPTTVNGIIVLMIMASQKRIGTCHSHYDNFTDHGHSMYSFSDHRLADTFPFSDHRLVQNPHRSGSLKGGN